MAMRAAALALLCALVPGVTMAEMPPRELYSRPIADWPAATAAGPGFLEFGPLPDLSRPADADRKIALGARLFSETALSAGGNLSCASCHDPSAGFSVPTPTAIGHGGAKGRRNPTSLWDTVRRTAFGWDGGSTDLRVRLLQPLTDHSEMGNAGPDDALAKLRGQPSYRGEFSAAFGNSGISAARLTEALAAYLETQTRRTRYDAFLDGDADALTDQEVHGLHLFRTKAGCAACHFGPRLTDDGFHNLGLSAFREPSQDLGRFDVTGRMEDAGRFQTPSLRHVATSAPYMHHGAFASLEGVVNFYAGGGGTIWARTAREAADSLHKYAAAVSPEIKPLDLNTDEKAALVAFLKAL